MSDCVKRQQENYKGEQRVRCINPEAAPYRQVVNDEICNACPVKVLLQAKKPCEKKPMVIQQNHPGYPECPFRYTTKEGYSCSVTGLPVDKEICGRCVEETRERESTLKEKGANYWMAIRRWVASGRPTRSQEEIDELFNKHCKACKLYDPEKHACKNCGCKVSESTTPLANKLAMATEHCPLGRF